MTVERVQLPYGAAPMEIETGRLAKQAHGSILVNVGGTTALVAVTHSDGPLEGKDFFPLMVDYREKFYASGRMPGGFFRREARPGDMETLRARLIDRAIRPLFPEGMRHEIMVYVTVISSDNENQIDTACLCAASIALQISDVPFPTPVAAVRVGRINGEYILNPTYAQAEEGDFDILVAGTPDAINMVEAGAKETSEEVVLGALRFAHDAIKKIIAESKPFIEKNAQPKFDPQIAKLPEDLAAKVREIGAPKFAAMVRAGHDKKGYYAAEHAIKKEILKELGEFPAEHKGLVSELISEVHGEQVRILVCKEGKRVDKRAFNQIRPISTEVGVLAKTHGSSIFTRGQTQALGVVTLGTLDDAQKIDNMLGISEKRFMLHYNFPPWSVGEAKPMRASGRREIGHGMLAERALSAVLPTVEEFPYTIRVVSEILESNGSSSMASACVGCLAMMDAGVPLKKPVAGIAMGLVSYGDHISVLTDIQGIEDHLGDMDFKVTGTRDGITALQMDIKIEHVTIEVLEKALAQAKEARLFILGKMAETLAAPRPELSPNAPRLTVVKIPVAKIGAVIGPGGKVIRGIIERTGVKIDVQDDGTVYIASNEGTAAAAAEKEIRDLVSEVEMGKTYTGKVVRITDFGAFVQLLPNKDGLVHISELDTGRVERVDDVCAMGDEMTVKVINIDDSGKVRLSRKAVLMGDENYVLPSGPGGGGDRGPRGGFGDRDRDRGPRGGGDRDRGPRGGGYGDRDRGPRGGGDRDRDRPPHGDRDRDRGPRERGPAPVHERDRERERGGPSHAAPSHGGHEPQGGGEGGEGGGDRDWGFSERPRGGGGREYGFRERERPKDGE